MNEIFFNPATQFVNTGDLLINKSLIGLLRAKGQLYIDDKNKPGWFLDELLDKKDIRMSTFTDQDSLTHLLKLLWQNKIKKQNIGKTYFLVFVPGHLSKKGLRASMSSIKILIKFLLLKLLGCRLIKLGISLGTFDTPNALTEALITRCYSYFAVRDYESILKAKRYRFKLPEYFPDLAWAYKHEPSTVKHINYLSSDIKFAVMSFRANELGHGIQTKVYTDIAQALHRLLQSPVFENIRVVFSYQVDSDRDANLRFANDLSKDFGNIEFFETKLFLDNAFDLYSKAEFVITNRLHVMLLAMQANRIAFPLIDEKVNSKIYHIMKDNNLLDLVLNINDQSDENFTKIETGFIREVRVLDNLKLCINKNASEIEHKIDTIFN